MDDIWERAVETALDGERDDASARTLTLDGVVKCVQGQLPPPSLLERFQNLQHLSIANVGVSSLEQFPRLLNLETLVLSDNRIASGLQFLVHAGLDSLRDLDLSNNRIQYIEDLVPLAQLNLVSLDLYKCPVTRVKDYRSRVFGLIKSLKYLDKMDVEKNERPESDDEDEEEEEDDPGSGEIDGEDRHFVMRNGHVDADDEEGESDADEEEMEPSTMPNGAPNHQANGFRVEPLVVNDVKEDEEEENNSGEEIDDDDDDDEDDDVVEVYEIEDSDDEEDGEEYDEEEVDNDERVFAGPESTGHFTSLEGEIDGHEQGEEDGGEDDDGETAEDEIRVEYDGEFGDDDEEEDFAAGYLVRPVGQSEALVAKGGSMNRGNDDGEEEEVDDDEEEENDDDTVQVLPPTSSHPKRKRDDDDDDDQK